MKNVLLILTLAVGFTARAQSKDSARTAAVKALVESQNYVFHAQSVAPARSYTRFLESPYSLQITKARIDCNLPYYGHAYTAPIDPSKNGMDFVSKQFEYTVTPDKKGGWQILIKPKAVRDDSRKLYLRITRTSYTTLRVISTNEDEISYVGAIAAAQ